MCILPSPLLYAMYHHNTIHKKTSNKTIAPSCMSMPHPTPRVRVHRRVHGRWLRGRPWALPDRRGRDPLLQKVPLGVLAVVRRRGVFWVYIFFSVGRQGGKPAEAAQLQLVVELRRRVRHVGEGKGGGGGERAKARQGPERGQSRERPDMAL